MQSEKAINFTIDEAIQEYLFISENIGTNKFIDIDNPNLIWTFEDVNQQTCYLKASDSGPDDTLLRQNIERIQNRRTNETFLITNISENEPNLWVRQSFEFLYSKSLYFLKRDVAKISDEKRSVAEKPSCLRLISTWPELSKIIGPIYNMPLQVRKSLQNIKLLFKQPFFSIFTLFEDHSEAPCSIIVTFNLNKLFIIEIINITNYTDLLRTDEIMKNLVSAVENENVRVLLVADKSLLQAFDLGIFDDNRELLFYRKYGKKPFLELPIFLKSDTLRKKSQFLECIETLNKFGLPKHIDLPKNWDCLAALSIITEAFKIEKDNPILDAGGEYYSAIMHQLASLGFEKLFCINTIFEEKSRSGMVNYEPGDITNTSFNDKTFGAITCLSVIEHGVDIEMYLSEMSRILKPGGVLITSCDYWIDPIDTHGLLDYGVPVKIFNENDIDNIIVLAKEFGLQLIDPIVYKCEEQLVECNNLNYTFIYFTFRKEEVN